MAQCAHCGAETVLHVCGTPCRVKCVRAFEAAEDAKKKDLGLASSTVRPHASDKLRA